MLHGPRKTKTQRSKNTTAYRKVFLEHVHQLIQFGYSRLTPANHVADDEPAITGHLVDSMNDVIDDKKSPRWARFYSVHDDPPVRHQTKTGKRRKRVDIRFDSIESIPRTRFFLEAKRLGKKNPVGDYLGDEGLGCFLSDEYAVSEPDGGMLAYVQDKDAVHWASSLLKRIGKAKNKYAVCANGAWKTIRFAGGPAHTFTSRHTRKSGNRIDIYHSFLIFQ